MPILLRTPMAAIALAVTLLSADAAQATSIIYTVSRTVESTTVTGTITTDGTLGVLTTSNILDWDITLSGAGSSEQLTLANSTATVSGNGLAGTPGELIFDFDFGPDPALWAASFEIAGSTASWTLERTTVTFFDFGCFCTVTAPFSSTEEVASGALIESVDQTGAQSVGTAVIPEPSTGALLAVGLLSLCLRRRGSPAASDAITRKVLP